MIQNSVKIHDNFSLEIKSIYENISKSKKTNYDTITYLFIPNGLNINNQTYSNSKFYNDVKVYIRYNASAYTLEEIINLKTGPLNLFAKSVKRILKEKLTKKNRLDFESKVKMLGAILNNSLKLKTQFYKSQNQSDLQISDQNFFIELKEILQMYRVQIPLIENSGLDENLKNIIKLGDEYLSNISNYYTIQLFEHFKKSSVEKSDLKAVIQFIKEEQEYRKAQNFDASKDDDYYDEILLHKRSQLKKYIEGVLFLNRDIRKDGAFVEQSVFAIAAGLAMVFSTGIAFYYQQVYGNFTLPFFIVLVVGYMFKDRIKSSIGQLFISKASSFFYDYKIKIKDHENNLIGITKENFAFVPFEKLGPKVKRNRVKNGYLDADYDFYGEQIIQYKRKIEIYPKKFGQEISDNRLKSLVDITRFNFYRFIAQMDDPKKSYSILKKGKIINRIGNKIYHINVIQKIYSEQGIEFKRYRVIMNRKGIKRIESVKLDVL
ncbi:hypothetical protein [Lutibacter sp.]|uniref:hypothetical protein n=1 Tax=Lutibacter sp. TaxID=1925666 RepID=UPI001A1D4AF5|nr:hypothetical protein [Lutibacter sp.]MBI9040368.1 hypothetical protein [Lutibacter sp.]